MKSERGKAEYVNAIKDEYGDDVSNPFQLTEVKEKINLTKETRHGDSRYNNSQKAQDTVNKLASNDPQYWEKRNEKSRHTWLKNYGVDHPMKVSDISTKSHLNSQKSTGYKLGDSIFDSIPELTFALYCRDKHIEYIFEDQTVVQTFQDKYVLFIIIFRIFI